MLAHAYQKHKARQAARLEALRNAHVGVSISGGGGGGLGGGGSGELSGGGAASHEVESGGNLSC